VIDEVSALGMMGPLELRDGGSVDPVSPGGVFVLSPYGGEEVDLREWALDVGGLVGRPRGFSYGELVGSFDEVHEFATLECVINPAGGGLVGTALWSGVSLGEVLGEVGVEPGAVDVLFRSADGLVNSLPVGECMGPGVILAYEMNGRPLPVDNGFPVRVVAPGFYGFLWRKWLTGVEAMGERFVPTYEHGNPPNAERLVLTTKLLRPGSTVREGPCSVVGASWGGEGGVGRVEVSVDGGVSWEGADLIWRPPTPHAWTIWEWLWEPSVGEYVVTVRATDGEGNVQSVVGSEEDPSGLAGLDRARVTVI